MTHLPLSRRAVLRGIGLLAASAGMLERTGPAAAHPLPGSKLVFSTDQARLVLTVSVPLVELALAMGKAMPDPLPEGPISPDLDRALAAYFADHLKVASEGQPDLDLRLTRANLERATQEDVGAYTLVVLDFSAPIDPARSVFPLTLTYDAILHQVRNHSATVFVQAADAQPVAVGLIRLDLNLGTAAPLIVPAPP